MIQKILKLRFIKHFAKPRHWCVSRNLAGSLATPIASCHWSIELSIFNKMTGSRKPGRTEDRLVQVPDESGNWDPVHT
jgi:hypothetical protein